PLPAHRPRPRHARAPPARSPQPAPRSGPLRQARPCRRPADRPAALRGPRPPADPRLRSHHHLLTPGSSTMPSQNFSTTVAEIDRDHRMIVLALLRRLAALSTDQLTHVLANGRVGDPLELCQELEALLATSRAQYRRLNNARIQRRGRASSL